MSLYSTEARTRNNSLGDASNNSTFGIALYWVAVVGDGPPWSWASALLTMIVRLETSITARMTCSTRSRTASVLMPSRAPCRAAVRHAELRRLLTICSRPNSTTPKINIKKMGRVKATSTIVVPQRFLRRTTRRDDRIEGVIVKPQSFPQLVIAELLHCDETAHLPKSGSSLRQPGDLDDFETHGFASRPCDRFAFIGNPV